MGSLNNPLNNALNSLVGNIGGIFTGQNPLTQPRIGELFGFNVQGKPLISTRDYFLSQMDSWISSIPIQSQWIILIQPFPACVNTSILQDLMGTWGDPKNWDIDRAKNILTSFPMQKVNGCLFAQKVQLPAETLRADAIDIKDNRGFLPGVVSQGKSGYAANAMAIDFLETNASFTDFFIRPWVIAAEHFGLAAREDDTPYTRDFYNVKSTIYVLQYSKTFHDVSMIPRKVWTFHNCVPTSVATKTLQYTESTTADVITTQWTYTNYSIANSLYLPLPQILDSLSNIFGTRFSKFVDKNLPKKFTRFL